MRGSATPHATHLVIHMSVHLPPTEVVFQNSVCWVTHGAAIKHGCDQHFHAWQVGWPQAHITRAEAAGDDGDQLTCAPLWGGEGGTWDSVGWGETDQVERAERSHADHTCSTRHRNVVRQQQQQLCDKWLGGL